ncbi:Gtr1/RagA G protein Gtr2 [Heliocybe sulcata]|uniref:GTP-binding protein n=1 Tax=Heliocybe sulcata TaxID=5364 RepID=A0A5C3N0I1_9AGAM|nr:Gtr1/RagA G protein Gtr2 [Heliocybe sulcata]
MASSRPSTLRAHQNGNGNSRAPDTVTFIRTKVLLTGLRRCGKTSIYEVLFNGMEPKQTFYIETTTKLQKHHYECVATVIPLEVWDCPWNTSPETLGTSLAEFSALIFVIDIQDMYQTPIAKLLEYVVAAAAENPELDIEVFVHKSEALPEDLKYEHFRHIQTRVLEELYDAEYDHIPLSFHLTSVFDHTLHEAFSRVLHKLVDSLPYLEDLMNVYCANSQSSKAFLFDVHSRLYVATDSSPVDGATHSLCCDYLQMLNNFGSLYRHVLSLPPLVTSDICPRSITASPPRSRKPYLPASPLNDSPASSTKALSTNSRGSQPKAPSVPLPPPEVRQSKELFYPSASTSLSATSSGTTLTYHLVTPALALLSVVPTAIYETRRGLLEYNVVYLREGVQEIYEVEREARVDTANGR